MHKPEWQAYRSHLAALHAAALDAAAPGPAVRRYLKCTDGTLLAGSHAFELELQSRVHVVAFGKASVGMAAAAREVLGERAASTVVSHPQGIAPLTGPGVRCFAGGHPIPDEASLRAGAAVVAQMERTGEDDVVLVLVSGGGSALLEALHEGVELTQLRDLTARLQRAGADIFELNTVRRALSRIKGGGLARMAAPSRVVALLLSDVLGDDPRTIASGPTLPSPTGAAEAVAVIERRVPGDAAASVLPVLRARPADPQMPAVESEYVIVGSNGLARHAVLREARSMGFSVHGIDEEFVGEARQVGATFGRAALEWAEGRRPACVIGGGETTVTVTGDGRGGRNQEFALGAAGVIEGHDRVVVLSFGTDGIDGRSRAAGAIVTGDTMTRAGELGLSAQEAFRRNDCEAFFEGLGDLWVTGPTGTNVNDVAIALVY